MNPLLSGKLLWKVDALDLDYEVIFFGDSRQLSGGRFHHIGAEVEKLDYHHYLPIFFDGLREKEDPYRPWEEIDGHT